MNSPPQDPLARALEEAMKGKQKALFDLLARGSHLPGPRMNEPLAEAFAAACRSRGPKADAVALALARLSAIEAPGATALEFLPVCGLYAIGARAFADETAREALMAELHSHADDSRFRARDAVVQALVRVGGAAGDALAANVASWMDGYFHAAAVVRALSSDAWLGSLHDSAAVVARLDQAFSLAFDAPRAAARWPGHKELLAAVERGVPIIAAHFGVPVFDMLVRWAATPESVLRELVARVITTRKLVSRFGADVTRVQRAIDAATPPPRNPDHNVGPTRDRSRKRRRGQR